MGAERADLLGRSARPRLARLRSAPRDQVAAVGAERHGEVLRRPARELKTCSPGPRVPDLDRKQLAVRAGGGDPLAVGVPGHADEEDGVWPLNSTLTCPVARVPDLGGHAPAGRSDLLAVGADRHAPDFIAVCR